MDIKPVASSQRNLGGWDFFLLWAGVAISLAEIVAGGFLAPLGFWMGLWAILLGHLIGNTLMALGGVIGSEYGIMSMVSVRPSFGIRGSGLGAALNIIQLIGWAAIMLIIGGRVGAMLGSSMGGIWASSRFWIVLIGMGTLVWALYTGKSVWKIMQNAAVIALLLVIVVMSGLVCRDFAAGQVVTARGGMSFMSGLDLVIAMPISWMPLVADYSRFSNRTGPAFWNTWWGYFIISSWMYVLGLMAVLVTGQSDPGGLILVQMSKIGLAIPALIMVVFSTITSDFPDVYSATCSMMNISERVSHKTIMWIAGILSILVALAIPNLEQYENFLFQIGAMFLPLFGVVLTDYFLIRGRRLDTDALYAVGGAYWYAGGFNPIALVAWGCGFLVYEIVLFGGYPIGGSIPSMAAAGLCYLLITKARKGQEHA